MQPESMRLAGQRLQYEQHKHYLCIRPIADEQATKKIKTSPCIGSDMESRNVTDTPRARTMLPRGIHPVLPHWWSSSRYRGSSVLVHE